MPSLNLAYDLGLLGVEVSQTIVEEEIIGILERNRTFLWSFYRKYFENQEKLINEIAHKNYKGNSTSVHYLFYIDFVHCYSEKLFSQSSVNQNYV